MTRIYQDTTDNYTHGLFIGVDGDGISDLTGGKSYEVSYNIEMEEGNDFNFKSIYLMTRFGTEISNTEVNTNLGTVKHTITPNSDCKLVMFLEFGPLKSQTETSKVKVSNIQIYEVERKAVPTGDDLAKPVYPLVAPSTDDSDTRPSPFEVRDIDGIRYGTITGDGQTYATMICAAQGEKKEAYERGMLTGKVATLEAGASYQVSFKVKADRNTGFEVCYNKDGDWGAGEKGFGGKSGLTATAEPITVIHTVTADAGKSNDLSLRLDLGLATEGTKVTVSDIKVRKIASSTGTQKSIDSFATSAVWVETGDGYGAQLVRGTKNVELVASSGVSSAAAATSGVKLMIDTGVPYEDGKAYRVSFDIEAEESQKEFCAIYNTPNKDYEGKWEQTLYAGVKKTIVSDGLPAGQGNINVRIELGKLDGGYNIYTVSNVKVEQINLEIVKGTKVDGTVTCDTQPDYTAGVTREKDSASVSFSETPDRGAEPWKAKMFIDTGVMAGRSDAFRVTFDVLSEKDMDFEVCYNREGDERYFDGLNGLHAEGGKVKTVEKTFPTTKEGILKLQLNLGMAKAPNTVTVSNLKVERASFSYGARNSAPEIDYKAPGAVSYWFHEDYTTTFTSSGDAITANITRTPQAGAEPWKIKLFLDTGVVLQPGKHYKVTANVKAKVSQDYEICYNNGGIEMGYDSMSGLHLMAGRPQTAVKVISVPADKAGAANLVLQFNLGKTSVANEVTVSDVTVEEVSLSYAEMMAKDFTYTGNSVGLWTYTDDTAMLESSANAATVHITNPSLADEVWKVKLLVNTGVILSPGKTYLVRTDMLASQGQNYEVCFNNEETEKGFDALYGQTITAGNTATVEKSISVPASMTDAGELILQFSVGGGVTNDITVSNVSVQELNFGTGSGSPAPDTVIELRQARQTAAGTLDVTREKLTYKMTKISSQSKDNSIAIAGANLRTGDMYTVVFTAKADKDLTGTFALNQADGGTAVISEQFKLAPEEATYSFTTQNPLSAGGFYDMVWQFGSKDNQELGSADVEIANISVTCPSETLEVVRSTQNVMVNGKAVMTDAYNVNGSNYFKLRDLAMMLNDTDGQFVVRYNPNSNSISLTAGKPYTPLGGELTVGEDQSASCVRTPQDVAVNGKPVNLKAYNIGGSNFFKLRDLNELLGFTVDYAAESNTVMIASPMTPEAQEKAHAYDIFFLPEVDGEAQPYPPESDS